VTLLVFLLLWSKGGEKTALVWLVVTSLFF
jgi:hypothetical protein